jgi:nicotinamide-nucleotide amidase
VEVVVSELDDDTAREVSALAAALKARGWTMCAAESCTGGLIAAACTSVSGSSDWFERGYVTYSNGAKTDVLGVDTAWIERHGAVSESVARAMAEGALTHSKADAAVAVTGIAGPTGATPGKPIGTVWIATATRVQNAVATRLQFDGDRAAVRRSSVRRALQLLREAVQP